MIPIFPQSHRLPVLLNFASHISYNIFLYVKGLVNREWEFENFQDKEEEEKE